jgi:peptide/nickel transport system permease protein
MSMEPELLLSGRPLEDPSLVPGASPVVRSNWQIFRRRFFRHKMALVSMAILLILIVACFGAPWLAPFPQGQQNLLLGATGPSAKHWFGTDDLGRDQLSEIMYAGRVSLMIGLVVALLSTVVGVTVGATAAYFGKATDQGLSAVTDLFLILPDLALLAVAILILGQNYTSIIIVLAVLSWMYVARIVRAQVLSLKEKEFVEAARASGASTTRILVRHIVPNCTGTIMVNATLAIAAAVSTEAALSFLGFGVQPPQNSWGRMLSDGEAYVASTSKFYLVLFPGLALLLTVLAVNFLGDALRDAFDPQSRH